MTFQAHIDAYREMLEHFLNENLSNHCCVGQEKMAEVMRYSALAGGKRIRPVLTMEFCRVCGGNPEDALPFAAALEMIHTYSLIHDDLPCMDDDDLRRGKPTSHKIFGEAMAVLAGDALLTRAFELTTSPVYRKHLSADDILAITHALACKAGIMGMIGGQVLDMEAEKSPPNLDGLIQLQHLKTGALIQAAVEIGCILGGGTAAQKRGAEEYASALGLAFQIKDDMLDVEGDTKRLGKTVGADAVREKATFPVLAGMDACRMRVLELTQRAVNALSVFEDRDIDFLKQLALELAQRDT